MKKTLLTGYALLFCTVSVLSQVQHISYQIRSEYVSGFRSDRTPAAIRQTEKDGNKIFSFELLTSPDKELLDQSMENFRQIEGFVSLSVNERNVVEVITAHSISEKDNNLVLMVSARMYGYLGFKIIA